MFSQEAIKHANACSICWMCRHLCPIGNMTGREIHFPRGKATLVALTGRGNDVVKDSGRAMYDCLLCNHCADWCETGYEPAKFIREARRELVVMDCLPADVRKVIENTLENGGCLYGEKHFEGALAEEIASLKPQAQVLLVLGDGIAMKQPDIGLALISLFKKAGVDFTVLKDEPTPGADLYDLIGELADVQQVAQQMTCAVKRTGCELVVAADPRAARIMQQDYPRWGCELPPVVTATSFVSDLLEAGKLTVKENIGVPVTFHDPEQLSRDLKETEPARKIIQKMAVSFKEIFLNKNNTRSCGNHVVGAYAPSIIPMTARTRMDDAMRTGAQLIVTASPTDRDILSSTQGEHLDVEDIFVLLNQRC